MIEKINWDESLVKKYSSSNHFKLLNQLRNEVEKYPLNKKKNISSDLSNINKFDNKNNKIISTSTDLSNNKNSDIKKEINYNKSNVSFNNSKNFSIYKNPSNDNKTKYDEANMLEEKQTIEEKSSSTFKDRLTKIDRKKALT